MKKFMMMTALVAAMTFCTTNVMAQSEVKKEKKEHCQHADCHKHDKNVDGKTGATAKSDSCCKEKAAAAKSKCAAQKKCAAEKKCSAEKKCAAEKKCSAEKKAQMKTDAQTGATTQQKK